MAADSTAAEAREAELRTAALGVARELSAARRQAARRLEQRMADELAALGMSGAQLGIEQEADDGALAADGIDRIEFLLAANPGEPPKPLARVASGGELSRIMLALKALAATAGETPILIFDEVDAGIGGSVAVAVARRLKALAQTRQLLCITHLAQIAAYADHHVRSRNARAPDASSRMRGRSTPPNASPRCRACSAAPRPRPRRSGTPSVCSPRRAARRPAPNLDRPADRCLNPRAVVLGHSTSAYGPGGTWFGRRGR